MPDPTVPPAATPTDQTSPLDAGHTTSEYSATKWIVILTSIVTILTTVGSYTDQAKAIFGADSKIGLWIAIGSVALGALTTILYSVQRAAIKIAAIKAGKDVTPTAAGADAAASKLAGS